MGPLLEPLSAYSSMSARLWTHELRDVQGTLLAHIQCERKVLIEGAACRNGFDVPSRGDGVSRGPVEPRTGHHGNGWAYSAESGLQQRWSESCEEWVALSDVPLAERGRLLSELAATLSKLPADQAQTCRLGEAMRQMLHADGVAITVEYLSDNRVTLCASDEAADALETLQEVTGEGPGFEAARNNVIVVADLDGDADQRWPMLAHALEERLGALRVYAIPLNACIALAGVATLHTGYRQSLAESPERIQFLANAVGAALLADAAEHPDAPVQMGEGWSSRSKVHQATGMVMAQVRVTSEDALVLLRGHAYALGTDINDVAARVIDRSIDFTNFDVQGD
jgi:hypothetical protein